MLKYLDTCVVDIDRLKKARSNINKGTTLTFIFSILILVMGATFMFFDELSLGITLLVLASFYLIMAIGLVIKREIFSIMIFLRTKQEVK